MDAEIEIKLVRKEEQSAGSWAGGTTTQLAIWPPEADYKRRDFMWRISTARVDLEESSFTPLPGFHRLLMILEGTVRLVHEAEGVRRELSLNPFEQDAFEGAWSTVSRGRCVDFNLMTAPGCGGRIEALRSARKSAVLDLFEPDFLGSRSLAAEAFYCLEPLRARSRGKYESEFDLKRGDFLMFRKKSPWNEPVEVLFERAGGSKTPGNESPDNEGSVWGIRTTVVC
jgi:hypothetical protein